jgi:hypothetical protein
MEGIDMNTARQLLFRLIDEIPDETLPVLIDYVAFMKSRKDNYIIYKELEEASVSSIGFWNNSIDDEVWNNV